MLWGTAALSFTGVLCAVLGAVMIVELPSIIKQQVHKVGERPQHGLEDPGRQRGPRALLSKGETRAHREGAAAHLPRTHPNPG